MGSLSSLFPGLIFPVYSSSSNPENSVSRINGSSE